jgi:hypothetical protein
MCSKVQSLNALFVMSRLERLQLTVAEIRKVPLQTGPLGAQQLHRIADFGLVRGHINFARLEYVGVTRTGVNALQELTKVLRDNTPLLRRAVNYDKLSRFILDSVLRQFADRAAHPVTSDDYCVRRPMTDMIPE